MLFLASQFVNAAEPPEYEQLESAIGVKKIRNDMSKYYESYYEGVIFRGASNHKNVPTSRYMQALTKRYNKFESQILGEYKNIGDNEKIKMFGMTRNEVLANGKRNLIDNSKIYLNNIALEEDLFTSKKILDRLSVGRGLDRKYFLGLSIVLRMDPFLFRDKNNIRVKEEVSPNIAWVTYDLLDKDGGKVAVGHALVFSEELTIKLMSSYKGEGKLLPVEWIGITIANDHTGEINSSKKYSISKKLNYGSSKNTYYEGMLEKFQIRKKDMTETKLCKEPTIYQSINYRSKYKPFQSLNKMINLLESSEIPELTAKYPKLFNFESCLEKLEGKVRVNSEDITFTAEFLPNYGLVKLDLDRTISKVIPDKVFMDSVNKNWGKGYKKQLISQGMVTLVDYQGLTVKRLSSRKDTSVISYLMNMELSGNEVNAFFYNSRGTGGRVRLSDIGLISELPYKILDAAPALEPALLEMFEIKKSKTATDVKL